MPQSNKHKENELNYIIVALANNMEREMEKVIECRIKSENRKVFSTADNQADFLTCLNF